MIPTPDSSGRSLPVPGRRQRRVHPHGHVRADRALPHLQGVPEQAEHHPEVRGAAAGAGHPQPAGLHLRGAGQVPPAALQRQAFLQRASQRWVEGWGGEGGWKGGGVEGGGGRGQVVRVVMEGGRW